MTNSQALRGEERKKQSRWAEMFKLTIIGAVLIIILVWGAIDSAWRHVTTWLRAHGLLRWRTTRETRLP